MKAEEYLKFRNIIQKDKKDLFIKFDDKSEVSLTELLESFLKENSKCACCKKRHPEICGSCAADVVQSCSEQAMESR